MNHITEKPKIVHGEAEENHKMAEFSFLVDLKTPIVKTSVDLKLLHSKICLRNNQKEQVPKIFFLVFTEFTERFGLIFVGDNNVKTEEKKKEVVDALHFGRHGSSKMLAKSNIIWWSEMRKYIEETAVTAQLA